VARGKRAAGVVVARPSADGWRYLVLRAYRNWDFPKGIIEPDEVPLAAAVREVREETALADLELRWDEVFTETEPYAGGKVARYYVAVSPAGDVTRSREHHEHRWATREEARRLLGPRLQQVLDWAVSIVEA
jgi:bis(5'-nucleosidyl)-tetraphosphatase